MVKHKLTVYMTQNELDRIKRFAECEGRSASNFMLQLFKDYEMTANNEPNVLERNKWEYFAKMLMHAAPNLTHHQLGVIIRQVSTELAEGRAPEGGDK